MAMLRMIQELSGKKTREELRQFFHLEARIASVATLARLGRHEEADALAAKWPKPPPARLLDLRARIAAQQGKWTVARQFWEDALKADPGNAAYEAGLDRIKAVSRWRAVRSYWRVSLLASLTLGFIAVGAPIFLLKRWDDLKVHKKSKIEARQSPTPSPTPARDAVSASPAASPPRESLSPAPAPTEPPKPEPSPVVTPTPTPMPENPPPAASASPENPSPSAIASPEVSAPLETGPAPSP